MQGVLARVLLTLVLLGSALCPLAQAAFQYLPAPTTYVTDLANVLQPHEKEKLEARLQSFQRRSGLQSVILIVPSLQGDVLEDVAVEQFKRWGIGSKKENSGLLLFVAVEDRAVRIEVGYGLEDRLTDAESGRIIREEIVPFFRQQRFYDALLAYQLRTEIIFRVAPADAQSRREHMAGGHRQRSPLANLLFLVMAVLFIGAKMLQGFLFPHSRWRNLSSRGGLSSPLGWGGGFGGGGFGGGGGFSGGGGMSGGGGASGRW